MQFFGSSSIHHTLQLPPTTPVIPEETSAKEFHSRHSFTYLSPEQNLKFESILANGNANLLSNFHYRKPRTEKAEVSDIKEYLRNHPINISPRQLIEFLNKSLYEKKIIKSPDCLIGGGVAKNVLGNIPFSDIDVSYYIEGLFSPKSQGKELCTKELILASIADFIVDQMATFSDPKPTKEKIITFLEAHIQETLDDTRKSTVVMYLPLGNLDLKFIGPKAPRMTVSTAESAFISYAGRNYLFVDAKGNICDSKNSSIYLEHLHLRQYVVYEPEVIDGFIFRILVALSQGFRVDEQLIRIGLKQLRTMLIGIKASRKLDALLASHQSNEFGRKIVFLNLLTLVFQFEDPSFRMAVVQDLAIAWQSRTFFLERGEKQPFGNFTTYLAMQPAKGEELLQVMRGMLFHAQLTAETPHTELLNFTAKQPQIVVRDGNKQHLLLTSADFGSPYDFIQQFLISRQALEKTPERPPLDLIFEDLLVRPATNFPDLPQMLKSLLTACDLPPLSTTMMVHFPHARPHRLYDWVKTLPFAATDTQLSDLLAKKVMLAELGHTHSPATLNSHDHILAPLITQIRLALIHEETTLQPIVDTLAQSQVLSSISEEKQTALKNAIQYLLDLNEIKKQPSRLFLIIQLISLCHQKGIFTHNIKMYFLSRLLERFKNYLSDCKLSELLRENEFFPTTGKLNDQAVITALLLFEEAYIAHLLSSLNVMPPHQVDWPVDDKLATMQLLFKLTTWTEEDIKEHRYPVSRVIIAFERLLDETVTHEIGSRMPKIANLLLRIPGQFITPAIQEMIPNLKDKLFKGSAVERGLGVELARRFNSKVPFEHSFAEALLEAVKSQSQDRYDEIIPDLRTFSVLVESVDQLQSFKVGEGVPKFMQFLISINQFALSQYLVPKSDMVGAKLVSMSFPALTSIMVLVERLKTCLKKHQVDEIPFCVDAITVEIQRLTPKQLDNFRPHEIRQLTHIVSKIVSTTLEIPVMMSAHLQNLMIALNGVFSDAVPQVDVIAIIQHARKQDTILLVDFRKMCVEQFLASRKVGAEHAETYLFFLLQYAPFKAFEKAWDHFCSLPHVPTSVIEAVAIKICQKEDPVYLNFALNIFHAGAKLSRNPSFEQALVDRIIQSQQPEYWPQLKAIINQDTLPVTVRLSAILKYFKQIVPKLKQAQDPRSIQLLSEIQEHCVTIWPVIASTDLSRADEHLVIEQYFSIFMQSRQPNHLEILLVIYIRYSSSFEHLQFVLLEMISADSLNHKMFFLLHQILERKLSVCALDTARWNEVAEALHRIYRRHGNRHEPVLLKILAFLKTIPSKFQDPLKTSHEGIADLMILAASNMVVTHDFGALMVLDVLSDKFNGHFPLDKYRAQMTKHISEFTQSFAKHCYACQSPSLLSELFGQAEALLPLFDRYRLYSPVERQEKTKTLVYTPWVCVMIGSIIQHPTNCTERPITLSQMQLLEKAKDFIHHALSGIDKTTTPHEFTQAQYLKGYKLDTLSYVPALIHQIAQICNLSVKDPLMFERTSQVLQRILAHPNFSNIFKDLPSFFKFDTYGRVCKTNNNSWWHEFLDCTINQFNHWYRTAIDTTNCQPLIAFIQNHLHPLMQLTLQEDRSNADHAGALQLFEYIWSQTTWRPWNLGKIRDTVENIENNLDGAKLYAASLWKVIQTLPPNIFNAIPLDHARLAPQCSHYLEKTSNPPAAKDSDVQSFIRSLPRVVTHFKSQPWFNHSKTGFNKEYLRVHIELLQMLGRFPQHIHGKHTRLLPSLLESLLTKSSLMLSLDPDDVTVFEDYVSDIFVPVLALKAKFPILEQFAVANYCLLYSQYFLYLELKKEAMRWACTHNISPTSFVNTLEASRQRDSAFDQSLMASFPKLPFVDLSIVPAAFDIVMLNISNHLCEPENARIEVFQAHMHRLFEVSPSFLKVKFAPILKHMQTFIGDYQSFCKQLDEQGLMQFWQQFHDTKWREESLQEEQMFQRQSFDALLYLFARNPKEARAVVSNQIWHRTSACVGMPPTLEDVHQSEAILDRAIQCGLFSPPKAASAASASPPSSQEAAMHRMLAIAKVPSRVEQDQKEQNASSDPLLAQRLTCEAYIIKCSSFLSLRNEDLIHSNFERLTGLHEIIPSTDGQAINHWLHLAEDFFRCLIIGSIETNDNSDLLHYMDEFIANLRGITDDGYAMCLTVFFLKLNGLTEELMKIIFNYKQWMGKIDVKNTACVVDLQNCLTQLSVVLKYDFIFQTDSNTIHAHSTTLLKSDKLDQTIIKRGQRILTHVSLKNLSTANTHFTNSMKNSSFFKKHTN